MLAGALKALGFGGEEEKKEKAVLKEREAAVKSQAEVSDSVGSVSNGRDEASNSEDAASNGQDAASSAEEPKAIGKSVWTGGVSVVADGKESKIGVPKSAPIPYEAQYIRSLLKASSSSFTVSKISDESDSSLPVPSGLLLMKVHEFSLSPVFGYVTLGDHMANWCDLRKVTPTSDHNGRQMFVYVGALRQDMRDVAPLILRKEKGVVYPLPLSGESLRKHLMHFRSGEGCFELSLPSIVKYEKRDGSWQGFGMSIGFEYKPVEAVSDSPPQVESEAASEAAPAVKEVQGVISLKVHDVLASRPINPRLSVSVLGSPASNRLQPSDVGDSAMMPLANVAKDKIVLKLLDYEEKSDSYLPLATAVIDATGLANGKTKIDFLSDDAEYSAVVSSKLHYI